MAVPRCPAKVGEKKCCEHKSTGRLHKMFTISEFVARCDWRLRLDLCCLLLYCTSVYECQV